MKILGRVIVVAILIAGLCVLAYPGYRDAHYPNAREARSANASIPAYVPDDAREIVMLTNLDTMQRWGCFDMPAGFAELRTRLVEEGAKPRAGAGLPKAERMFGSVAWWPRAMSEPGVERYDLPSKTPDAVAMIGLLAREKRACFYSGHSPP